MKNERGEGETERGGEGETECWGGRDRVLGGGEKRQSLGGGRERGRDIEGDGGGGGGDNNNTLLHKNKYLSSSRLFYTSVPDDKYSNTQFVKQECQ